MVKGVNRQVLEISQPENPYFERILLFVKPEFSGLTAQRLSLQAKDAVAAAQRPVQKQKRRGAARFILWLRMLGCAGAGAALFALGQMIFGN